MNYLAHLALSEDSDAALVGNLMGDFVKGRLSGDEYPPAIQRGILLHRRVDSFTDSHPVFHRSRSRLSRPQRRFGGIIVDMAYDHFLARRWEALYTLPLETFAARTYTAMARYQHRLPQPLDRIAAAMAADDWLCGYRQLDVLDRSLLGVARRMRRPTPLAEAGHDIRAAYTALARDFEAFWPELEAFAATERQRLKAAAPSGTAP